LAIDVSAIGKLKAVVMAAAIAVALRVAGPTAPVFAGAGFVEVDAVAIDREGRHVYDLAPDDFELKEDSHVAPILAVDEVSTNRAPYVDEDRLMALVLDDVGVGQAGTAGMQGIARAFLAGSRERDSVAVLHVSRHENELMFGHLSDALIHIRNYSARGGVVFDEDTFVNWLKTVADISRQFGDATARRKAIVAIGTPALLDPVEPADQSRGGLWPRWLEAITNTARVNAALYVIDPSGFAGSMQPGRRGLAEQTGGLRFSTLNLRGVFEQIWEDVHHYYVVSYVPLTPKRFHRISVSAKKRGVRVRARQIRGE